MKMIERNEGAAKAALLIHPMLSSAEGLEQCVTSYWGGDVHCFIPDLSAHGAACTQTYHSAQAEAIRTELAAAAELEELKRKFAALTAENEQLRGEN